ncbi:MAG: PAS domain S-box protein [Nitrospirae bacterium]|nr:PAS domain S-box protein [Nitrospirota bacterium]
MAWSIQRIAEMEYEDKSTRATIKAELRKEIRAFDLLIEDLRNGSPELYIKPIKHYQVSLQFFDDLTAEWNSKLKPLLMKMAELSEEEPEQKAWALLRDYNVRIQGYVREIDRFVKSLELYSDEEIRRFERVRIIILCSFVMAAIFIGVYLRKSVIRPLRRLTHATEEMERANFDVRLAVQSGDEIGTLTNRFNEMAGRLKGLFTEKARKLRELGVLNTVSHAASESLALEVMAGRIIDAILDLEPLALEKKGAIFLSDNGRKELKLIVSRNFGDDQIAGCGVVRYGECLCGIAAMEEQAVLSKSNTEDTRHSKVYSGAKEHGHVILPLKSRNKVLGVLCLYLPGETGPSDEDLHLYASIADIIAVAMQNAINHRQVAMLAQSLDSSNDVIIIADVENRIIHINPEALRQLGYSRDELIGQSVSFIQSPDNPPGLGEKILKKTLGGGWFGEVMNRRKDGSEYFALLTTSPVKDPDGQVIALIGIARDITEHKRAEEELKKSAARLINAQRIAHLGNWDWDIAKNKAYCSEEVDRIFGFKFEEFGRTYEAYLNIVHPDDKKIVEKSMEEAFSGTKPFSMDHRTISPDGTVRIVHVETEATFDEAGTPVRMTGTIQDITERRRAEEELDLLQKLSLAISEAEDFNSALNIAIRKICDVTGWIFAEVWVPCRDGTALEYSDIWHSALKDVERFVEISRKAAFAPGTGLPGRVWASKKPEWVMDVSVNGVIFPRAKEALEIGIRSGLGIPIIVGDQVLAVLAFYMSKTREKDSHLVDLVSSISAQLGSVVQRKLAEEMIIKYNEVLEEKIKKRTAELEVAKQAADESNRAKSDFLANMSHELRTPLNAIIGFSSILVNGMSGPVTDEQTDFLRDIENSGKHLLTLINDILDLSKVEAGKMELEPSEFGVKDLIERCLVMFKEKSLKHGIHVEYAVEEALETIIADEMKIKQILVNLLSNAFKYTPEGGSVRVRARSVERDEGRGTRDEKEQSSVVIASEASGRPSSIEISVTDTGPGIKPEDIPKLFQPFQQLETTITKKYPGTGLGLNLCKKYVELHGGAIWVESEVGKGSKFIFSIPIMRKNNACEK